ncbi:hypothetical protein SUGI_0071640 [Cryptomeria japonica]|uniref:uncharacterized protein LOC131875480 n=1 Tax=Cryptomeria japonica TaxID=3369 RepID=UPI002408B2FD|nr:uncharacterized protein LOC131875480 [Cryptomeria japonica]GLJ07645.1 hypothetical protein SUGI_0071640 [Cryptomeria japonica]
MENLRKLELRANKGSPIQSCIQTIQEWPEEMIICMPAVPNASSLVDSFKLGLSPNLSLVDTDSELVVQNHSFNGNAIMCCFVISRANNGSNLMPENICLVRRFVNSGGYSLISRMKIGEGRWVVIGVFPDRCTWIAGNEIIHISSLKEPRAKLEVERGLCVKGEKQKLVVEALLPLLQTIST